MIILMTAIFVSLFHNPMSKISTHKIIMKSILETNSHILIAFSHMFIQNFKRGTVLIRKTWLLILIVKKRKFP